MLLMVEVLGKVLDRLPLNMQAVTVCADPGYRVMRMARTAIRSSCGNEIDLAPLVIRMTRKAREAIVESRQVMGSDDAEVLVIKLRVQVVVVIDVPMAIDT